MSPTAHVGSASWPGQAAALALVPIINPRGARIEWPAAWYLWAPPPHPDSARLYFTGEQTQAR